MKNILNRGFSGYSNDEFVTKINQILTSLTGNPNFLTTDPTLAQITTALGQLISAMSMPDGQARDAAVAAKRATLEQLLEELADNLEKTSNNDPAKLATAGFNLRKESSQSGAAPDVPQNARLKLTGVTGEVQFLCDAPPRSRSIQVQTAADPNGPWVDYETFSSTRGMMLKGFPRAKDLWVRARAIGPNNTKSGWSDPATILVA